jgi:hypothetical protein
MTGINVLDRMMVNLLLIWAIKKAFNSVNARLIKFEKRVFGRMNDSGKLVIVGL